MSRLSRFLHGVLVACGIMVAAEAGAEGFRAAVTTVDVTPETLPMLVGYAPRAATGVNDRLHHRILALDDGATQFFLISSEFGSISPAFYDRVAARLEKEHGIAPQSVWWTMTHTHSAPEVGSPGLLAAFLGERFLKPFDADYAAWVERRLIEGVIEARAHLEPARLGVGWGMSKANINRRARLPDGRTTLGMNPEGPVDDRIGLLRVEKRDGSPIALVANYAIHGTVLGSGSRVVSGDVTGIVSDYVERKTGVPLLFINGAAGDLAPIYSGVSGPESGELSQFELLLGDRILEANARIAATSDRVTLTLSSITVETPQKPGLTWPEELANYARTTAGGEKKVLIPVRFLRVNEDIAIWSAPLELFCEVSNGIRDRSPYRYTFYFGYANGWLGYLPTAAESARGGYEPMVSPFTAGAEKDLAAAVTDHLRR